jgi:hypothetical protein
VQGQRAGGDRLAQLGDQGEAPRAVLVAVRRVRLDYPFALTLMVGGALVIFAIFRRRDWL